MLENRTKQEFVLDCIDELDEMIEFLNEMHEQLEMAKIPHAGLSFGIHKLGLTRSALWEVAK